MSINEVQRQFEDSLQRSLIRRAARYERERLSMFRQPFLVYVGGASIALLVTGVLYAMKLLLG